MKKSLYLLAFALLFLGCKEESIDLPDGMYAKIETDKGEIITTLEYEKSPVTVANFITLAEGKNPFVAEDYKGKPFFDGLTFHRVEKSFMIQSGDPDANGSGGPGYRFKDEFSDLKFDKSGVLAMANGGPGTNGSQFFITHVPTPWLEGKHTIFGYVTGDGMETVNNIEIGDVINSITIIRKGESAKRFDASKVFNDYVTSSLSEQKKQTQEAAAQQKIYEQKFKAAQDKKAAECAAIKTTAENSKSGLQFKMVKKGTGQKPKPGEKFNIYYSGYLENGMIFDTNQAQVAKEAGIYDSRMEAAGRYLPMTLIAGKPVNLVAGFKEAIGKLSYGEKGVFFIPANLAYGAQGAGNVVPPNANLVFEMEMTK
jgi:cyclophilin family peptidyl-prolyl cis-trans isomerase